MFFWAKLILIDFLLCQNVSADELVNERIKVYECNRRCAFFGSESALVYDVLGCATWTIGTTNAGGGLGSASAEPAPPLGVATDVHET
jgi:hypothetical protein